MVGFKTVWTLLILLVFAACVPQTKSTSCKSTEAFSASLRTCVPLVNGPSSFINISTYSPSSSLVKYKNDFTIVTLNVVITNPYAQAFTVQWERNYAGVAVPLTATASSATSSTYAFQPASLGTELGIHSFQVKILDASGSVVDSQNFQITINNNPKPIIVSTSVEPVYHSEPTPLDLPISFEFTESNNGASMTGAGYRTDWYLYKNGVLVGGGPIEIDTYLNLSSGATNFTNFLFDPAAWGLGNYIVKAKVTNTALEVVAEQQWSATVAHPDLSIAQGQPIYASGLGPAYSATNIAYNGVDYNSSPTLNFIPTGYAAQGNYCVNFTDPDGAYPDATYIRVDYYLDGSTLIYSGFTSAGDAQVCLSDAPPATLSGIVFNNASPNSVQTHIITARAVDLSTNFEYTSASVNAGLIYPFKWNFSVKPVNLPPTLAFSPNATLSNITCPTTVGTTKSCNVTQGSTFRVGITATDDFYNTATDLAHFSYSMTLYRGVTPVSSCTKLFTDVIASTLPPTDFVGPDFLCDFVVPTYDTNGSINPTADAWSVGITFSDDGSTVSGSSAAASVPYTYSLTVAEYSNPAGPTISPQGLVAGTSSYLTVNWVNPGAHTSAANSTDPLDNAASASFVTEGDTLSFNVRVADPEMDDYKVTIYLCTDFTASCVTSTPIVPQTTVPKTDSVATQLTTYTYLIPENLVPITSGLATNVDVFFKVVVADFPDYLSGVAVTSIMSTNVRNKNPAPVVDTLAQVPVSTGPHNVVVGYPFSIDPGTITDLSLNAAENNPSYQWYVSPDNATFTAIAGATSRILYWTPTSAYGATAYLKMCVSDGTTIHPVSADFATVCTGTRASSSYQIAIKSNVTTPSTYAGVTTPLADPGAIWYDTSAGNENVAYVASVDYDHIGLDYYINVAKLVRQTSGLGVDTWSNAFEYVRFKALQSVAAAPPTDLSITGTANSLYVAYKCAPSSAPASGRACLRRIEKGYTAGTNEKTNLVHKGKFGFSYTGLTIANAVPGITYAAPALGASYAITFSSVPTSSAALLTINGVSYTADGNGDGIVDPNEFCGDSVPGCTTTAAAASLRDLINQSSSLGLQGVTATLLASTVTIHGVKAGDSLDSVEQVGGLGKISFLGTEVHVPYINKDAPGADENKISVLRALADTHLGIATIDGNDLFTIDPALSIATDIDDNGNLVIAVVSALPSRAGQGRLYSVGVVGGIYSTTAVTALSTSLFGGYSLSSLRVSASRGVNAYNYVAAYDNFNGKWKIGRHLETTLALSNTTTQALEDLTPNPGTGADDVVVAADIQDVQIATDPAINGEARVAIANFGTTVTDGFYLLRWKATNSLGCPGDDDVGSCVPFSTTATDVNSRVYLSSAQTSVTSGAAGFSAGENITNVVHALLFSAAAAPSHMVLNIVPESIQGNDTTNPAGTSGWMPPYVK